MRRACIFTGAKIELLRVFVRCGRRRLLLVFQMSADEKAAAAHVTYVPNVLPSLPTVLTYPPR